MQFCPKCGAILIKKTKNFGCPRCNYSSKDKTKISSSEEIEKAKEVSVVNESKGDQTLPIVPADCPKCKNSKAYFWVIQTRSSDEAETKFFKCTKCEHTWREYE
ncbi:MAG: transcription factor S [Nanoarchaeota archaeon]